jgi:hypothetical protein
MPSVSDGRMSLFISEPLTEQIPESRRLMRGECNSLRLSPSTEDLASLLPRKVQTNGYCTVCPSHVRLSTGCYTSRIAGA